MFEDYTVGDMSGFADFVEQFQPHETAQKVAIEAAASNATAAQDLLNILERTPQHVSDVASLVATSPFATPAGGLNGSGIVGEDELLANELRTKSDNVVAASADSATLNTSAERRRIFSNSRMSYYVMETPSPATGAIGDANVNCDGDAAVENGGDDDGGVTEVTLVMTRKRRSRSKKMKDDTNKLNGLSNGLGH